MKSLLNVRLCVLVSCLTFFCCCIFFRTDPTSAAWATTWMSGIALAILGISLISGAIFALYWARKNKRNMKASYPGKCPMYFPRNGELFDKHVF